MAPARGFFYFQNKKIRNGLSRNFSCVKFLKINCEAVFIFRKFSCVKISPEKLFVPTKIFWNDSRRHGLASRKTLMMRLRTRSTQVLAAWSRSRPIVWSRNIECRRFSESNSRGVPCRVCRGPDSRGGPETRRDPHGICRTPMFKFDGYDAAGRASSSKFILGWRGFPNPAGALRPVFTPRWVVWYLVIDF